VYAVCTKVAPPPFPSLPAPSVVVSSRGNAWLHPVCRSRWRRRFCAPTLVGTPLGRVPKADAGERRKFDHLRRWPPWEQGRTQGRRVARNGGRGGNGDEAERCFALSPEDEEAAVVHRRKSQTAGLVYGPPGRSIDFTECTQGTAVHGPCLRTTTITNEGSAGVGPEEIQRVGPTSCFVPGTRARRGERRVGEDGLCGPAQRDIPSAPCLWQFLATNPQPTTRLGWPLCLAVSLPRPWQTATKREGYPATFFSFYCTDLLQFLPFQNSKRIALLYSWKYVGRKPVA
jgi:hypothetical protein